MKYKAVIFDLDGTLIDSLEDIANSANNILRNYDLPVHPVESYKQFVGDGVMRLIERILPEDKRKEPFINMVLDEFRKEYHQNCDTATRAFEGIEEMLMALKDKGIKMAVLSNKTDELSKRCARKMLPAECFEMIRGHIDSEPRKPDPKVALDIVRRMDVSPSETIFVGDMDIDINTAINAGFLPVGVSWGLGEKQQLTACGAKIMIDNAEALLAVFDGDV